MSRTKHNRSIAGHRSLTVLGLGSMVVADAAGGAAALGQVPSFYQTAPGAHDLTVADFNRDGFADLAVACTNGDITILTNDQMGQFPNSGTLQEGGGSFIVAGDMDGDRDIDLVTAWGTLISVLFNDGLGQFDTPVEYTVQHGVHGLALGDVTGDGVPDVVLSEFHAETFSFEPLLNDGHGALTPGALISYDGLDAKSADWSAVTGDFDGDGDIDAAMMQQDYGSGGNYHAVRLHLMINEGDGTQWTRQSQLFNQGDFVDPPNYLKAGDFDGDGDLDLIYNDGGDYGGYFAMVAHLTNDGRGNFVRSLLWLPRLDDYAVGTALSDYDGDGGVDSIVAVNLAVPQQKCAVYLLRAGHQYEIMSSLSHGRASAVAIEDLNGDGMRDIVVLSSLPEAGVLVMHNSYVAPRPVLQQTALRRGQQATFEVTGAEPGEMVRFLYSLSGVGMSTGVSQLGGLSIDLGTPFVMFASVRADGSGSAQLVRTVPLAAPANAILATQAVIRRGTTGEDSVKTNFITMPIQP